jgi:hypothetical protein
MSDENSFIHWINNLFLEDFMKYCRFLAIVLTAATLAFTACSDDGGSGGGGTSGDIDVVFQSVAQVGGVNGTADSTSLTLTFDVDPATLTAENITVTGATKGALTGSGTTRSLTISNITVANGETVSVTITSPTGYSITGSPQTAVVYRQLTIGMDYLGGKIAYILQAGDPGYDASVPHGLIAATEDQSLEIVWISGGSTQSTSVPGGTGTALGTGSSNTDNIIAQAVAAGNNTLTSYAAGLARAHNGGGYNDWYLPSKDELNKLYLNRVAIGGFATASYWSSSENDADYAWLQIFDSGAQLDYDKYAALRVRAVRAF